MDSNRFKTLGLGLYHNLGALPGTGCNPQFSFKKKIMDCLKVIVISVVSTFILFETPGKCADQKSYVERDGLSNLIAKLLEDQDVTIAYLGGSITAQPGYRTQTFQWFKDTWPVVKFTQVDAAIGGTGSSLGAFRLYNDVLSKNPDLVFIEFAVNDYEASRECIENIVDSVEGIIRQIIRYNPNIDMCFIYTITEQMLDDLKSGLELPSIIAHERVAGHYGLPSINVMQTVAELERKGKLIMKGSEGKLEVVSGESLDVAVDIPVNDKGQIVFSKDGVHPYLNSGHKVYTKSIIEAISAMNKTSKAVPHELVTPLNDGNLEKAKMIPLSKLDLDGDWDNYDWSSLILSLGIKARMPEIKVTKNAGDSICFKFTGTTVGIYDIMGPSGGIIECDIDGHKSYISSFDKYCTYYRIGSKTFDLDDGFHLVQFTMSDQDINKTEILKQIGNVMDDPSRFAEKTWYIGNILLIGDLIVE